MNKQNLGGLGEAAPNRISLGGGMPSDIGSMYRGAGDEDALSHYMGQSDYGGATEIGAQSLIGGQNTHTGYGGGSNMMALKPPGSSQPGKRRSEYARRDDAGRKEKDSGLPPRDRAGL